MPSKPFLRALDPQTEQSLFRQAFDWRKSPRRDRVAFEVFAADDPNQIVLGLFADDDPQAVYIFYQLSPTEFDAHFTSSRKADKSMVWAAAVQLVQWFREHGLEIVTHIRPRNIPLRRFVESIGLSPIKVLQFDTDGDTVPPTTQLWVEYRSGMVPFIGPQRQETNHARHDG